MTAGELRVATFNIRHGRVGERWPCLPWRLRAGAVLLDADVVALQEVDHRVGRSWLLDQTKLVARAAGATDHVFCTARPFGPGGRYGNALAVRGRILSYSPVELPRGGRAERRICIVAEVELAVGRVRVAVTHLQNHHETAVRQLAFVADLLAGRHDHDPAPTILLGDLNLTTDEVTPALVGAGFDVAGGANSSAVDNPSKRIDHVAVRGFAIGKVDVPRPPVSDHRPVIATLHP